MGSLVSFSRWYSLVFSVVTAVLVSGCPLIFPPVEKPPPTEDIAREWNALMLEAVRNDSARPTVHARNLFHVSVAMYDAWAAYDEVATAYLTGHRLKQPEEKRTLKNRAETLSHAVYGVLTERFAHLAEAPFGSPAYNAYRSFENKMISHGYMGVSDVVDMPGPAVPSEAQALGARIAEIVLDYGARDGANEANNYADLSGYASVNPPVSVLESGTNGILYPEYWQPVVLPNGAVQQFLTPHWGDVASFALPPYDQQYPRLAMGTPPQWGASEEEDAAYIDQMLDVILYSAALDPEVGSGAEMIDISPGAMFNNSLGENDGFGREFNPFTGAPYPSYEVKRGDWYRTIAEFWADGPGSETPPGHWNVIANDLLSGGGVARARLYNKSREQDLAYDVKLYFVLNAALHDAAIATWDVKSFFDSARPISGIRFLAEEGLLPVMEGVIDFIEPGDPLAGPENEFAGQNKIVAWLGPNQGVGWMRGGDWRPYQAANFVTPPFGGYTSGHSAFSRAAAEVLTLYSGDPYFPEGSSKFVYFDIDFDTLPEEPVGLHWATYYDAADEAGLSRLSGGIHVRADDFDGRFIGDEVGRRAFEKAQTYFEGRGVAVAKDLAYP